MTSKELEQQTVALLRLNDLSDVPLPCNKELA